MYIRLLLAVLLALPTVAHAQFFGQSGCTTNCTFTGTTTLSGMTTGSVLFIGPAGAITQSNANFFWDNTNLRLGIGTASPQNSLHILNATNETNIVWLGSNAAGQGNLRAGITTLDGTGNAELQGYSANTAGPLMLNRLGGNVQVGSGNFTPITNGVPALGASALGWKQLYLDYTNTATVGAVTISKAAGRVNMAAGGTTLTVTNTLVTVASHISLNAASAPGNAVAVQLYAVPAAGSFTVNAVPAVTNQTAIDFLVINAD